MNNIKLPKVLKSYKYTHFNKKEHEDFSYAINILVKTLKETWLEFILKIDDNYILLYIKDRSINIYGEFTPYIFLKMIVEGKAGGINPVNFIFNMLVNQEFKPYGHIRLKDIDAILKYLKIKIDHRSKKNLSLIGLEEEFYQKSHNDFAYNIWIRNKKPKNRKKKITGIKWGRGEVDTKQYNNSKGWGTVILSRYIGVIVTRGLKPNGLYGFTTKKFNFPD